MNDFSKLFFAIIQGQAQHVSERRVAIDEIGPLGISTVLSCDMGYETALGDSQGNWHPVARYDSREAAVAGHTQWVARVRSGEREFTELGYGDAFDPRSFSLS